VAYTATKHAITGLTKATALDGRAHDIACGRFDIGNAATALTEAMAAACPRPTAACGPSRIDVADEARAVCYMASLPWTPRRPHDRDGDQDAVHRPRPGWPVTTSSDLLAEGDCSGAGGSGMVRT
jgi:NAD(P)-dependent dehydrogenase (short-subunit alcohol dehydrogenase family)